MKYSVQQTVLNLLSNSLFGTKKAVPAPGRDDGLTGEEFWEAVLSECTKQSILPVVTEALPEASSLDAEERRAYEKFRKKWSMADCSYFAMNARVSHEHEEIHRLMTENGIPYVIIKGRASAAYYPKPHTRAQGDVDFFVDRANIQRAMEVLDGAGYVLKNSLEKAHHHIAYEKFGVHMEMHFGLNGIPEGEIGNRIKESLPDIVRTAQLSEKLEIMVPSDFYHGLVILLHNARHMTSLGIGLRHISDWATFAGKMGESFPQIFESRLNEIGLWEYANILTATATYAIGLPRQSWCKEYPEKFLAGVLADIYMSGNFGQKARGVSSYLFIQDTNGDIEDTGIARRFFLSLNRITRSHWPVAKKVVILYPVGWAVFSVRQLILIASGKRKKIDVKRTLSSAKRRNDLYREMHLFEKQAT